jgi:hypothetical protein
MSKRRRLLLALGAALAAAQLVPYGRDHTNPPVTGEPAWASADVRALADRACFDCHSNESRWPWYSNVAPASWLIQRDVDHGRKKLNFSEWNRPQKEADEAAEAIVKGAMPMPIYLPLHPEARLSPDEKDRLVRGLQAMFGGKEGAARGEPQARGSGEGSKDDD